MILGLHTRFQKVLQEEVQLFFLEWRGSKQADQMVFHWQAENDPTMNAGLVAL